MSFDFGASELNLLDKMRRFGWGAVIILSLLASVGVMALYSAANGDWDPWAKKHAIRFAVFLIPLFVVAIIDLRHWLRWAYFLHAMALLMLVYTGLFGHIGMGAQRWINLGFIQIQPSEIAKITLVLVLARLFSGMDGDMMRKIPNLLFPAGMALLQFALVAAQPDLGAGIIVLMLAAAIFFVAGAPLWLYGVGFALVAAAIPLGWEMLHEFQRKRIEVFLNPALDPKGAGYHITQSLIALASGGLSGKGFLNGSQSHLNYLPEKQTDFIFALWVEEFGLYGGLGLILLYAIAIYYGLYVGLRCRNPFGRLVALGLSFNLFLYVALNIAMVMGLIPVVGEPLPLVSNGGTAMLTTMIAFGLILSALISRDAKMPKGGM